MPWKREIPPGRAGLSDVCSLRRSENRLRVAQTPDPRLARREIAAARLRRQGLVLHLHRLGPSPLGHFVREVETGANVAETLEIYGRLPVEHVCALGGNKFPPPFLHAIDGDGP